MSDKHLSPEMEALVNSYKQDADLRLHSMMFCGDGKRQLWKLEYTPVKIVNIFRCEDRNVGVFQTPVAYYECECITQGDSIVITPIIPEGVMVQVDYWMKPD